MNRVDDSLIALRRILRATELFSRDLANSVGLSGAQFRVLQIVAEKDYSTATDISRRMRVSQATVTSLVDKLVKMELVQRIKSVRDRRQTNIVATELGRATIENAPDPLQQTFVQRFEKLEDWEQSMLIAGLERVAIMLDAEEIDASPVLQTGDLGHTHK